MTIAQGHWNVIIESPLGQQRREMTINAGTDTFRASVTGTEGTHDVSGTIDGNRLTWTDQVTSPVKLTLHFDVAVDGDAMTGVVKLGIFGEAKFMATRDKARLDSAMAGPEQRNAP